MTAPCTVRSISDSTFALLVLMIRAWYSHPGMPLEVRQILVVVHRVIANRMVTLCRRMYNVLPPVCESRVINAVLLRVQCPYFSEVSDVQQGGSY